MWLARYYLKVVDSGFFLGVYVFRALTCLLSRAARLPRAGREPRVTLTRACRGGVLPGCAAARARGRAARALAPRETATRLSLQDIQQFSGRTRATAALSRAVSDECLFMLNNQNKWYKTRITTASLISNIQLPKEFMF